MNFDSLVSVSTYPTPSYRKAVGRRRGKVWESPSLNSCLPSKGLPPCSILNICVHKSSAVQELKSFKGRDLSHRFVLQTLSLLEWVLPDPVSSCMCAHHWAHVVTLSSSRAGIVDSLFIPTAWETYSPWPMLGKWLNKWTNGWINGCVRMLSHVSCLWSPCPRGLCHTRATKLGLARWRVRSSPKGCVTQLAWSICLWNHLHN